MTATFERIPVDRITPHDRNVRHDLGDLDELAASIKAHGVLQPLVVAPVPISEHPSLEELTMGNEQYVLIAGHRRLAAAVKAGVESVPCIVRDDLDSLAKQLEAMLCENLQRTDLTVMEEADAYQQLELLGVKEAAIAKSTGRARKTVHQRLLLASLPTDRRQEFESNALTLDGAVQCAKLRAQWADDAEILALIDKAGSWSFGSSTYGVKSKIDRLLQERKRAAEPEPEPDDVPVEVEGQSTVDDQIRESAWEQRQKAERAEAAALAPLWERQTAWLAEQMTHPLGNDPVGWGDLAIAIVEAALRDGTFDQKYLELAGISITEDEDAGAAPTEPLKPSQALGYCLLCIASDTGANLEAQMPGFARRDTVVRRTRLLVAAGYEPTDEEHALITTEEAHDAEEE